MSDLARDRVALRVVFSLLLLVLICGAASATWQSSPSSNAANFDGPAELPREHVKNSLKDTPASGKSWTVRDAGSLERALAHASCGDTIQLQAGTTFSGSFEIPSKQCDDSHWIILRTSAPDSALPSENKRLTPCYGGLDDLPGRPKLSCPSRENVLAKIQFDGRGGSGPLKFAAGANHYRLLGLEVTRAASGASISALVDFKGAADHIVFDRMWLHGTADGETTRGISLGASRYVAIVDSSFTDFHCVARSGACTDAQAILGGIGAGPMGPYKISNNFLEASGENILFGGGGAAATPADIEIVRNHLFKPLTWMKGQPDYVGAANGDPFIAKNLFELKNGQRVLLDGNILENSWGGFSQVGFAILLTPKNQGGKCPVCQVTDVTIRYCRISHVAAGFQIANTMMPAGVAADGQRYSIHDVVVEDIDGTKYRGPGEFAQVSMNAGAPLLQNVRIDHVTAFPAHVLFLVGSQAHSQMKNFVFTNSIVSAGHNPVWSTGGGPTNCAYPNTPRPTLDACFSPYSFTKNVVIDTPPSFPPSVWPSGNFFPSSAKDIKFVNHHEGNGGDYHLQESSRYRHAGIDGKDLGADIDAIQSASSAME